MVTEMDDQPSILGEYWHRIKTDFGERKEPGSNLEPVPVPVTNSTFDAQPDMGYNESLGREILVALQRTFPRRQSTSELKKLNLAFEPISTQEWLTAIDALLMLGLINGVALRSDSGLEDAADIIITSSGRESLKPSRGRTESIGGTLIQNFNMQGHNSRINLNSTDNSANVSSVSNDNTFVQMREAAESIEDQAERQIILSRIAELEATKDSPKYLSAYQSFMAAAANHVTVFAPFFALLAGMLSHH